MTPPRLVEAADELLRFLDANGRSACLIGGVVVSRWGEPRATKDVDATVLVDFTHEAAMLDLLLSKFASRDPDPVRRAELGRLALLRATNGVDLDISFGAFPFEIEVLQRASDWQVTPDIALRTCSAEEAVRTRRADRCRCAPSLARARQSRRRREPTRRVRVTALAGRGGTV